MQRANQGPFQNKPGKQTGIKRSTENSGLFVTAQICEKNVKLLVDTGATLTILNTNLYNSVKSSLGGDSGLDAVRKEILSATNEPIKVAGKTELSLKIGQKMYKQELAIADIAMDGVIGLDFFNKYKCKVDIVNKKLLIGSDEVPMLSEGSIGCYRISVGETCSIPPRSEIIIYGDVKIPENDYLPKGVSLVEPEETFTNSDHGLVAKALVDNSKKVPLRIMNLSQDVKIIHSGTFVASMSPVDKVMDSNEQHTNKKSLSPAVNDLLKKMSPKITKKQTKQVEELLMKHCSLFANNDKELGKTGIVRHGIKTNDRPPVKQPLRRIPVHMKQEVDQHIYDMLERDVIEPSVSPWSAGVVLARKKDGTTRFCADYRKLNELTEKCVPSTRVRASGRHRRHLRRFLFFGS